MQMQLFETENSFSHLRWFLIIDSPYDIPVENAYFVGYSELGEIVCKREIALSDQVLAIGDVNSSKPQPVKVPPAKAKLRIIKEKEDSGSDD